MLNAKRLNPFGIERSAFCVLRSAFGVLRSAFCISPYITGTTIVVFITEQKAHHDLMRAFTYDV